MLSRSLSAPLLVRWHGPLLAAMVAACGGTNAGSSVAESLFDDRHLPDVLTEARPLALPPATGGNRFLAGWWPIRPGGRDALIAVESGGRVELAQLSRRPRRLVFDLSDREAPAGTVLVRAAGRDLGRVPVADPLVIDLHAGLPLGRVPVELIPDEDTRLTVVSAAMRTALAAGDARRDGADMLQSGYCVIDVVRRVKAGASLTGSFQPPASPRPDQEFLLHVERDGASQTAMRWRATWWNRLLGHRALDVPLGSEPGLVRVRLEARGEGPTARWSRLTLDHPATRIKDSGAVAETTTPSPSGPRPRLVILYVMDALRADHLGHIGGPTGVTPTLDRLARQGLTFSGHRSVAPNTLPSTKALLTGEAYAEAGGSKLPEPGPATLAEAFRATGYATALFSNNPYVSEAYGVGRGFDVTGSPATGGNPGFHDDAARIHAAALDWLRSLEPGQPAFLYLHTLHPHNPYDPPEPFRQRFAGTESAIDGATLTLVEVQRQRRATTGADRQRLAGLYAGALAYNDAELGKLLEGLRDLYPREHTFLAFTSDHGEELFDHDGVLHGYTLYEEMIRIPLVIWAPERVAAGERRLPSSTLDLHATLLRLAGAPVIASEGTPLLDGFDPGGSDNNVHLAAAASLQGGVFSAQSQRYKLIWAPRTGRGWGMGEALGRSRDAEYLFGLENDPEERINLAGQGGLEAAWLRSRLLAWVVSKRAETATEPAIDEQTRQRLRALGYLD